MQVVQQIDKKLIQTVPYYSQVASFATQHCKQSIDTINNLCVFSSNKVKKMTKASKQFKKDLLWMISQSTDDFLEFFEQKLEIECDEADEKNRKKRVMNIINGIKDQHVMTHVNQFMLFNKNIVAKGRQYSQRYVLPLYITVKATLLVSRQILMEVFTERMGQLKMTYQCSKDTITMFWSGEFKQQKVIAKIKENLGSFKQFTVNFVQKGMEIKISKKDLTQNYHSIMTLLTQILKGVSEKSLQQWTQTKTKTVNLYKTVLNRIKEKEIQIRVRMIKETPALQKNEPAGQPKIVDREPRTDLPSESPADSPAELADQ